MSNEYKDWRDDRVQDLIIEKYNLHITYYNPQRDGAYVGGYDKEDESGEILFNRTVKKLKLLFSSSEYKICNNLRKSICEKDKGDNIDN